MELNIKQRAFVREYLRDPNAKQAAIRAGYSTKTAEQQGSRLLRHVQVQKAINKAQEKADSSAIMDHQEACAILTDMARGNVGDYLSPDGAIDVGRIRTYCPASVAGIEQRTDVDNEGRATTTTKFKLCDRTKALERLSKMLGWDQPAKVAPTTPDGKEPYRPEPMDPAQAVELYMEAIQRATSAHNDHD